MGLEIERKFLVLGEAWRRNATSSQRLVQGYLTQAAGDPCSVRVRVGGDCAWLNIKSAVAGVERSEFEYAIPRADAEWMLTAFCRRVIEKVRHRVPHQGHVFEVDEFAGANTGLVVAELELPSTEAVFSRPSWLGREVSDRIRYYNSHLIDYPFAHWTSPERAGE